MFTAQRVIDPDESPDTFLDIIAKETYDVTESLPCPPVFCLIMTIDKLALVPQQTSFH